MLLLSLTHPSLRIGVVRAEGVSCAPSSEALLAEVCAAEERVRTDPQAFPEPVRSELRNLLRVGGYKPTGRNKPASELLLGFVRKESVGEENAHKPGLPRISNLVEINNLVSLESALPSSIFDADALGPEPTLRFGRAGEHYVFNTAGHSMELCGLPVVCRASGREPVGNPVRDSMLCKVGPATTRVLAVVYASTALPPQTLLVACERLARLLHSHADARHVEVSFLP